MKSHTALRVLSGMCASVPRLRGLGRVNNFVRLRVRDSWTGGEVRIKVLGFQMTLDPTELVDSSLIFTPQWFDVHERAAIRSVLRPGDVFVDVGANVGVYSLLASRLVGRSGRVLAIEANPHLAVVLKSQASSNKFPQMNILNCGVSAQHGVLPFHIQTAGNRGGSSLLPMESHLSSLTIDIECRPLAAVVEGGVRVMKLDIEGAEFSVLSQFLQDSKYWPDYMLVEQLPLARSSGDAVGLLLDHDYRLLASWGHNHWLQRGET